MEGVGEEVVVESEKAAEAEQRRQGGGGGEEEQRRLGGGGEVYCAVGKEEWKANLGWVLANLITRSKSKNKRLVFMHLHRPASRINMMGAWVPVSQLAEQEVAAYRRLEEAKIARVLDDLLHICTTQMVSASKIIIASDDTASGLVQFVDDHGVTDLVMGAASHRAYHRKMRAPRSKKALMVQRRANPSCNIWFVCKGNLICTRSREAIEGAHIRAELSSTTGSSSSPRSSVSSDYYYYYSRSKESTGEPTTSSLDQMPDNDAMDRNVVGGLSHQPTTDGSSKPSMSQSETMGTTQSESDGEIMDDALYEKLKDAIMEAENLKLEAYEETRRRQMADRDLADANKMADEAERWHRREAKHRKQVEVMLARERAEMERDRRELDDMLQQIRKVNDRSAELELHTVSSERVMSDLEARLSESYTILDTLWRERRRDPPPAAEPQQVEEIIISEADDEQPFRRFGYSELDAATNHFDESLRIDGGGGLGSKVYRGRLRSNMAVAVKVLRPDVAVSEVRFTREVEVISRVRHPGLVTLVGACPEARALVYELVPTGRSLEEHLNETTPLPWHVRCGVAHRTCSALSFLHSTLPRATVHGDVRPANILLLDVSSSCSSGSKLGGLGTRRLEEHPRPPLLAYADPQYLATGELTPRCDVYSLGVVLLRLVTGRPPFLARKAAEEAAGGSKAWHEVVDRGWPIERAREVAVIGLRCCCCDNTKGSSSAEVLLEEVRRVLEDATSARRLEMMMPSDDGAPSYFLCPILKEVMRDPQIAGDGFSYEAEAIKEWLDSGHDTSPMTNLKLPTRDLVPNHALRSAILEWRHRQGHSRFFYLGVA